MADVFTSERAFEDALVGVLERDYGWRNGTLVHPSEQDLLDNWAQILFDNNKGIDRLNGQPLTNGEMAQIIEQVVELRTPMRLNGFINGKTVTITRDNEVDALHFGKQVSLHIYDRAEIAGGRSRYQIARQPHFSTKSKMLPQRRGDVMLLINGMPLIHIELKRSGVPISQARDQIRKYAHEGVFTRLFSLVQVFVAMNPDDTVYFANPGANGDFEAYNFHWADFDNEPVNYWKDVARDLLSIPMAHQLIGFYSVADGKDNTLKVMRSYQYYAASRISGRVRQSKWDKASSHGGHVWHTTGSGKTMTSFKSAQLIATSKDADKVVFLVDRIELGTQSLDEYRNFADDSQSVQATENTDVLVAKLKSDNPANTLIVTSIQKMSNIADDVTNTRDLERIRAKHIVFIVDECHRSTFGDMMQTIRKTFPCAMFFGFTGTPIHDENQKKQNTTVDVFGDELHRYSIADGIRDHNVLGFDPYKVLTYRDKDLRERVALDQAKASSVADALADPAKKKVYLRFMGLPMADTLREVDGSVVHGIEHYIPSSQYRGTDGCGNPEHVAKVVEDIADGWTTLSQAGKFHAILATNSIAEAISYYRLFRDGHPELKVTGLFDPNIDNNEGALYKENGLLELLEGYNKLYGKDYGIPSHAAFKRDVAARLAHKHPYAGIEKKSDEQIDLLIVVDQMLTGFDSKWVNTLYLDKVLTYEHLIQAFSRTNRLFGPDKPFGTIRYYRYPHTMEQNVEDAVRLYSGDRPMGLFASKLDANLRWANDVHEQICSLFAAEGVEDFESLPSSDAAKAKFAKLFKELADTLEAAKIQGFTWDELSYTLDDGTEVTLGFGENDYLVLALRYKELFTPGEEGANPDVPYDIHGYLTEIDTGHIDTAYMNANFEKWLKRLSAGGDAAELEAILDELHGSFARLDREQQRYADLVIQAAQGFDLVIRPDMTFMDYINEYQARGKAGQVQALVNALGVNAENLRSIMAQHVTEANINEFGRLDALKKTVDAKSARAYFSKRAGRPVPPFKVSIMVDKLLREFILSGGFDLD
ncbi:MAG: HsdR family type I site-specific deoxyribonuclease [Atopobiaceae bacterium]|nr:HsdR family type I site-specific deoxyribonuclease [Atopobiaceae bacterium]